MEDNNMFFFEYLSFVFADEQPENEFQLIHKEQTREEYEEYGITFNIYYSNDKERKWNYLEFLYYYNTIDVETTDFKITETFDFLDYHYNKYDKDKRDFLFFVEYTFKPEVIDEKTGAYSGDEAIQVDHVINNIKAWIEEKRKILKKKPTNFKKELQFKDLFRQPYNTDEKIKELKTLLRIKGYINENNQWVGLSTNFNELATLYYVLHDRGIMINSKTPALRLLYNEFKLYPTDNELRNLTNRPKNETESDFNDMLKNWV